MNITSTAVTTAFDRWAQIQPATQPTPSADNDQDKDDKTSSTTAASSSPPPAPEGTGRHVDKMA